MTPIHGYAASIEAAKHTLEEAKNALARDVGTAIANAQWSFLRDRFDVAALVNHVTEVAQKGEFVSKLHAAADKARQQQSPRGRPRKKTNTAIQKAEIGKANPMAPAAF